MNNFKLDFTPGYEAREKDLEEKKIKEVNDILWQLLKNKIEMTLEMQRFMYTSATKRKGGHV